MTALDRLAEAVGIEPGYYDIWGDWHVVPAEAKRAMLDAMGLAADDESEVEASLAALDRRQWDRAVDPVSVIGSEAQPGGIGVILPADGDRRIRWRLIEEGGAEHAGETQADDLALVATHPLDGRPLEKRRADVPGRAARKAIHRVEVEAGGRRGEAQVIVAPGGGGDLLGVPDGNAAPGETAMGDRRTQLYPCAPHRLGHRRLSGAGRLRRACGPGGRGRRRDQPAARHVPGQPEEQAPTRRQPGLPSSVLYIDSDGPAGMDRQPGPPGHGRKRRPAKRDLEARGGESSSTTRRGRAQDRCSGACDTFRDVPHGAGPPTHRRRKAFRRFRRDAARRQTTASHLHGDTATPRWGRRIRSNLKRRNWPSPADDPRTPRVVAIYKGREKNPSGRVRPKTRAG